MLKIIKNIKDRWFKDKGVTSLFGVYLVILLVTIILVLLSTVHMKMDLPDYINFADGWLTTDGDVVTIGKVNRSLGFEKEIPAIKNNTTLMFRAKNINVSVYIDDVLYKDFAGDLLQNEKFYKSPGTYYVVIPLNETDTGKTLRIVVDCPYKNDSSCTITSMRLGDFTSLYKVEVNVKLLGFGVSIVLIVMGLCFVVLMLPMQKLGTSEIGRSLMYLGLFSLFIGVWSLTETKLIQLTTDYSVFVHYINNLSLMIAVIPIFIFFNKRHSGVTKDITVYIVTVLFSLSFIVSCCLHYMGIYDLHETIKLTQVCLIVSVFFTFYYAYRCFVIAKRNDIAFIGLFFIAFCSGLDVLLYYKQLLPDNSTFVRIGVLLYVLVLGIQLITEFIKVYQRSLKADSWHRMAYTDSLTSLYNRTAFSEDLRIIDKEKKNEGCAIVVFDLNDLKSINDTYGHSFGDMAIMEAAEHIHNTFSEYGRCYRIGGDEFVCILGNNMIESELQSVCNQFEEEILVINTKRKQKRGYILGIAWGYSYIDYNEAKTAKDAFDRADAAMYVRKQGIKKAVRA